MNYVLAGYGISAGVLALYALRIAWRARVLRRVTGAAPTEAP